MLLPTSIFGPFLPLVKRKSIGKYYEKQGFLHIRVAVF
jgi:hypothetical protein